jgi:hypothetical protein
MASDRGGTTVDGPGIPGWFVALLVIGPVIGIGSWLMRMSIASRMAQRAGLNPNDAAVTTALSADGLAATYIATSLHQHEASPAAAQPSTAPASTEARLRELERLHGQGLVNETEYAAQRKRILNNL